MSAQIPHGRHPPTRARGAELLDHRPPSSAVQPLTFHPLADFAKQRHRICLGGGVPMAGPGSRMTGWRPRSFSSVWASSSPAREGADKAALSIPQWAPKWAHFGLTRGAMSGQKGGWSLESPCGNGVIFFVQAGRRVAIRAGSATTDAPLGPIEAALGALAALAAPLREQKRAAQPAATG